MHRINLGRKSAMAEATYETPMRCPQPEMGRKNKPTAHGITVTAMLKSK